MKNIWFIICLLLSFQSIEAASPYKRDTEIVACDSQLQKYVKMILQLPNARKVIDQIQQEGRIRIAVAHHELSDKFGAYWDREMRVIGVHLSPRATAGDIIGSILFELHNALGNRKIDELDHLAQSRQISREKYVESMEYLEYQNSKKAAKLAEEGIQMRIFPADARLPTYKNFEEHFYYQKISGHSAWFAQSFDQYRRR